MSQLNMYLKLCQVCSVIKYSLPTGPPGDISDVTIAPDTITACSFVVQWSRSSSDPVCGSVWYTVTITEGGVLIITDNTTLTTYNVTGLNDNTSYHVSVTASNNAGSSSGAAITSMITNNDGKTTRPIQMYACMYMLIMKSPYICYTVAFTIYT